MPRSGALQAAGSTLDTCSGSLLIPLLAIGVAGCGGSKHAATTATAPATSAAAAVKPAGGQAARITTSSGPGRAAGGGERGRGGRHPRQPGVPRLPQRGGRLLDEVSGGLGAAGLRRHRRLPRQEQHRPRSSSAAAPPRRPPRSRRELRRLHGAQAQGAPQPIDLPAGRALKVVYTTRERPERGDGQAGDARRRPLLPVARTAAARSSISARRRVSTTSMPTG